MKQNRKDGPPKDVSADRESATRRRETGVKWLPFSESKRKIRIRGFYMLECSKCGLTYPDAYHFKNDGRTRPLICYKCYDAGRQAAVEKLPFNFGAAFLTPIWCLCHSRPGLGVVLILANLISLPLGEFVPRVLLWILWVSVALVFGFKGSRIAFQERGYSSLEEFKSGERSWQVAGMIAAVIEVGLVILVFYDFMTE